MKKFALKNNSEVASGALKKFFLGIYLEFHCYWKELFLIVNLPKSKKISAQIELAC